jgi:hypothetical protein
MDLNDFCCPLCGNLYNKINNTPRLLVKCGHTFCQNCISQLLLSKEKLKEIPFEKGEKENTYKFSCPEDKTEYENITKIEELPLNLYLINLFEKAKLIYNIPQEKDIDENENENGIKKFKNNPFNSKSKSIIKSISKSFKSIEKEKENDKENDTITLSKESSNNLDFDLKFLPSVNNFELDYTENNNNNRNSNRNINININIKKNKYAQNENQNDYQNEYHKENQNEDEAYTYSNVYTYGNNFNENEENEKNKSGNEKEEIDEDNLNSKKDKKNDICKIHNRKNELFCVDDKSKICTSCALFGEHKNHNVKSEEDIFKEITIKSEILLDYFEMIENFNGKLNHFKMNIEENKYDNVKENIKNKENILKEEVICFFNEIRFLINNAEKNILNNISENFEDFGYKKIGKFPLIIPEIEEDILNWRNE